VQNNIRNITVMQHELVRNEFNANTNLQLSFNFILRKDID